MVMLSGSLVCLALLAMGIDLRFDHEGQILYLDP